MRCNTDYVSPYLLRPLRRLEDVLAARKAGSGRPCVNDAPAPADILTLPEPRLERVLTELRSRRRWLAANGNTLAAQAIANEIAALESAHMAPCGYRGQTSERSAA